MRQAVILAAGFGSRLSREEGDLKPLREVGGASLIRRNILLLDRAGVEEVVVVVGYNGDILQAMVERDTRGLDIRVRFAHNQHYDKSNGLSVLAARPLIKGNFLLMMADHIFDGAIIEEAAAISVPEDGAVLCIDYKLTQVFDMDDATKVVTDGRRVLEIGKQLTRFNAVDTGIFACTPGLFAAIEHARRHSDNDDCSLSDGVTSLLAAGSMFVHDIGRALWQDVDDERCLIHAEHLLRDNMLDIRRHVARESQAA